MTLIAVATLSPAPEIAGGTPALQRPPSLQCVIRIQTGTIRNVRVSGAEDIASKLPIAVFVRPKGEGDSRERVHLRA